MKDVLCLAEETEESREVDEGSGRASGEQVTPRVVYTEPPILLAKVIGEEDGSFRIRVGTQEHVVQCDASVDPHVVRLAIASGARVVVERAPELAIVGTLQTERTLTVDRAGKLEAALEEIELTANKTLLRVPGAFIQLKGHEVEVFGNRVLTRARRLAKTLAAMIEFN
jgi:hypothetical protein